MTFLQPFILWALPLALFPVVLHFLNRMRHRSVPWGAMMFLLLATRSSTRNAKLRQFLILACRSLAVAALVLALARPLAQGWWGASVPDVIVLVLDRSASMEAKVGEATKRQSALQRLRKAAGQYEGRSRLFLLDSVSGSPQEIEALDVLDQLSLTGPTNTSADMPSLLKAATEWLAVSWAGPAEIWIASDLQASNWRPNTARWSDLATQMASLPQGVRIRLLGFPESTGSDAKVAIAGATRRFTDGKSSLNLAIAVETDDSADGDSIPVTVAVGETRLRLEASAGRSLSLLRHRIDLGTRSEGGWGFVEVPADANPRNNRAFFVYPPSQAAEVAVVSDSESVGRLLRLAAVPAPDRTNERASSFPPSAVAGLPWDRLALVLWQAPFPEGPTAKRLAQFVEEGGVLVFFPPEESEETGAFEGVSWGEVEKAEGQDSFRVVHWEQDRGPLADSQEGIRLPMDELGVSRRRAPKGMESGVLASFEGGEPLVVRREIGGGQVLFVGTLPEANWSDLGDGPVLVPMLQRLLEAGSGRLSPYRMVAAGEWVPDRAASWMSLTSDNETADPAVEAGVYRSGEQLIAVNRPAREDLPEVLGREDAIRLFGEVPVKWFGDDAGAFRAPEGELWRLLVGAILILLMAEGWLSLPERRRAKVEIRSLSSQPAKAG